MRSLTLGVLLMLTLAGEALAQDAVLMDQIPATGSDRGDTRTEQLSRQEEGASAPEQLEPREVRPPAPKQLTDEGRSPPQAKQLTAAAPTAEGPAPLSTPQQGRTSAVTRIEGEDRCDPAKAGPRRDSVCARVIERRSAEFERPKDPEPSPEARLLGLQSMADTAAPDARLAARRLAEGEVDGSLAAQAVAAGRERAQADQPETPNPGTLTPAAEAVIEALRQGVTSVTLPPR